MGVPKNGGSHPGSNIMSIDCIDWKELEKLSKPISKAMKIKVVFDNFTEDVYLDLEDAKKAILGETSSPVRICEVDADGDEYREFYCEWDVDILPFDQKNYPEKS